MKPTDAQRAYVPAPGLDPRRYLASRWVKAGIAILLVGAAPLVLVILAAAIGLWPDPNPNPIGPGLLFFFSFWPGVLCVLIGLVRVRLAARRRS